MLPATPARPPQEKTTRAVPAHRGCTTAFTAPGGGEAELKPSGAQSWPVRISQPARTRFRGPSVALAPPARGVGRGLDTHNKKLRGWGFHAPALRFSHTVLSLRGRTRSAATSPARPHSSGFGRRREGFPDGSTEQQLPSPTSRTRTHVRPRIKIKSKLRQPRTREVAARAWPESSGPRRARADSDDPPLTSLATRGPPPSAQLRPTRNSPGPYAYARGPLLPSSRKLRVPVSKRPASPRRSARGAFSPPCVHANGSSPSKRAPSMHAAKALEV